MPSRRFFATGLIGLAGASVLSPRRALAQAPGGPPESTLDRVQRSKILRLAVLPGEMPFSAKDQGKDPGKDQGKDPGANAWSGAAVEMGRDIAALCEGKLDFVESSTATLAADLQAGKADLVIGVIAAPKPAQTVEFTRPFFRNPFGLLARKGFHAAGWAELDKPEIKIAVENTGASEPPAKRLAPNATFIGFKTRDEALAAVQSGRADGAVTTALAGIAAIKRNPQLGEFQVMHQPRLETPIAIAIRYEPDRRWRGFLEVWIDYNSGNRQIRDWLLAGLGIQPEELPPGLEL